MRNIFWIFPHFWFPWKISEVSKTWLNIDKVLLSRPVSFHLIDFWDGDIGEINLYPFVTAVIKENINNYETDWNESLLNGHIVGKYD